MSKLDIKFNINGEVIELKDTNKVVKALTKKQRNEIDQLKLDIVSIDKQKIIAKKFEILGKDKLKQSLNALTSGTIQSDSLFAQMQAVPVGMEHSEFINYLNIKVESGVTEMPQILAQPTKIGIAEKWQSISFTSAMTSVTDNTSNNNFSPGTVKLLIQNNSISTTQLFNSQTSSVVGAGSNTFNAGTLFINTKPINLVAGDSLNRICEKINSAQIGVKASVAMVNTQFKLILESEAIGVENAILIDDPNGILIPINNSSEISFESYPQYEKLTLEVGDSLNNIAYKINKFEKTTNLRADVFQIGRGQYTLVLKSLATGINNAFEIIDQDNSSADLVLNGSNTGKVFGNTFNSTISGTKASIRSAQDAELIVDGTTIQSPTNSFNVYNGINIIIKSTSATDIPFEIKYDINAIFIEINTLVDKYNLFRQVYLDSISSEKKAEASQLEKNRTIVSVMQNMTTAFQKLESMDIGLTIGMLELEKENDDKVIKHEYQNMLILDTHKLVNTLTNNPEKIRYAFDMSFDSSAPNFIQPLISKSISVDHRALGAKKIDLQLDVDQTQIKVRSRASVAFTDPNNIVDSTGLDTTKLKAGTFWINEAPIIIKSGMGITDVISAINASSNMSRISASNNGSYISLTQYSGNFTALDDGLKFSNLNIYDPKNVLQNAFSSIMQTGNFTQSQLPSTGTFTINSISIAAQPSISALVSAINNVTNQTGVTASSVTINGSNYHIKFTSNKLQNIVIDNSGGGLGTITLPIVQPQQSNNYFFDTSNALKSSVTVGGQQSGNPMALIINGSDVKGGGRIMPLNINKSGMIIDNLEVFFIGDESDSTNISISQGLSAYLISQLDEIFLLQQGYQGSTSEILQVNHQLEKRKTELEITIKNKEEALKIKEKLLINKFVKAQSQADTGEAYITMVKEMMQKND